MWLWLLPLSLAAPEGPTEPPKSTSSPGTGEPITLPCAWEKGDSWSYVMERRRTNAAQPAVAKLVTKTPVEIIVRSGGNPAELSYDPAGPKVEGPDALLGPLAALVKADVPALHLTMKDGSLTGVTNLEEVVDGLVEVLESLEVPDEEWKPTMEAFRDPAVGPQALMTEPAKLLAMHCTALKKGQVVSAPMQVPSPFGALPGSSTVRYVSHDAKTLTIETVDTLDAKAMDTIVPQLLAQKGLNEAQAAEALKQLPPIETTTTGRMVYRRADGFPVSVEITQAVGGEGHPQRRTDTYLFRLVE